MTLKCRFFGHKLEPKITRIEYPRLEEPPIYYSDATETIMDKNTGEIIASRYDGSKKFDDLYRTLEIYWQKIGNEPTYCEFTSYVCKRCGHEQ